MALTRALCEGCPIGNSSARHRVYGEGAAVTPQAFVRAQETSIHYLLFYDFVPNYVQQRAPYRGEHLRLAWEAHDRGELVLAGALADPADGAILLFKGEDDRAVRAFAEADPYVKAGLVTRWSVRPWTTVVGASAATPVRSV